jgi:hypothetical protein
VNQIISHLVYCIWGVLPGLFPLGGMRRRKLFWNEDWNLQLGGRITNIIGSAFLAISSEIT